MCFYAYIMPRRHLTVNDLCIPEVRYCFCFPCTVLLQHGADPNIRNTDGKSALDLADPSAKAVLTGKMHASLSSVTCSLFCVYKFSIIRPFCLSWFFCLYKSVLKLSFTRFHIDVTIVILLCCYRFAYSTYANAVIFYYNIVHYSLCFCGFFFLFNCYPIYRLNKTPQPLQKNEENKLGQLF